MTDLLARDLVVVTGKGGVGKSTVAAALGVAAAARGLRTIVAEVASRDDVSRTLGGADGGGGRFEERVVADGLHHISIDPQHAMEEYLAEQLPVRALADILGTSRLFTYLAAATPGLRELLTVGKVWELAQPVRRTPGGKPYDLVVLDAPATGHCLALLEAPSTFAEAARVGPIARQGGTIDASLRDPRHTGVVLVATPEEMPVNEVLELRGSLQRRMGLDAGLVVVNGLVPDRFTGADLRTLDGAGDDPAVTVARDAHARARAQRGQLGRLRRGLGGSVEIVTLPQLPVNAVGSPEIAGFARKLAA